MKEFLIKKLPSFSVIGIEGSTKDGPNFVERLWNKAENEINDVLPSLKLDVILPIYWGLMSDFSHSLEPWENDFSEGLYLAGFELSDEKLIPPAGWSKWSVPAHQYLVYKVGDDYQESFRHGLELVKNNGYVLSGAVFDHNDKGVLYLYYPIDALS
jgi:hypothetical protein